MSKKNTQLRTVQDNKLTAPAQKRKKGKARKRIALFTLYAVLLGYGFYQICFVQQAQLRGMRQDRENLRASIVQEQEKNDALNQEYSAGNTEEVVEKIAREKLGLIKPDEKMFVDKSRN